MEQLSIGGIMNSPPVFIKNENSLLQTEQYSFGVSFRKGSWVFMNLRILF